MKKTYTSTFKRNDENDSESNHRIFGYVGNMNLDFMVEMHNLDESLCGIYGKIIGIEIVMD